MRGFFGLMDRGGMGLGCWMWRGGLGLRSKCCYFFACFWLLSFWKKEGKEESGGCDDDDEMKGSYRVAGHVLTILPFTVRKKSSMRNCGLSQISRGGLPS